MYLSKRNKKFSKFQKKLLFFFYKKEEIESLDLCVSSLRRGHANLLCINST